MNPLAPLDPYETQPNSPAAARLVIPQFLGGSIFLWVTLRSELRTSTLCLMIRHGKQAVPWFKTWLDWGGTVTPSPGWEVVALPPNPVRNAAEREAPGHPPSSREARYKVEYGGG
ncbi:hypothetical protein [Deinococcus aluminii]|uniref:Uncharacterized protein n=1 Tax=Deinococcus aluminii TaxID=1656885 RepID=A0ABP9XIX2_9DEIO